MLTEKKRALIDLMQEADVLRFGEFKTKSGRLSPYFVNTGNFKTGSQLSRLAAFYADHIAEVMGEDFAALFGPAYKGIPLSAAVAVSLWNNHKIDKPYFFNRKEAKDHGEGGNLVGYTPQAGDRIVVVEDVITAGTAVREIMPILKGAAENLQVKDLFISVNRMEVGQNPDKTAVEEVMEEHGITVHSLITALDIREYLSEQPGKEEILAKMDAYMAQYCKF